MIDEKYAFQIQRDTLLFVTDIKSSFVLKCWRAFQTLNEKISTLAICGINVLIDYQKCQSQLSLAFYRTQISLKMTELLVFQKCHLKKNTL